MPLPTAVNLIEVGPRDGLQNEELFVPTDLKVQFIEDLAKAGLTTIEATSFVSPKKIPQLRDHSEVFSHLHQQPSIHFPVLIPNLIGLERALAVGVTDIAVFTAASETFSKRNTGYDIAQSLAHIEAIITEAKTHGLRIRGYISCITDCAYEGPIKVSQVTTLAKQLHQMGVDAIALGDTLGKATPQRIINLIDDISQHIPIYAIALHCHDTYGQALANIYAALQCGITTFDCSAAGLGGCPYAAGASGNVATEDVLYLLNGLGITTGVDLEAVIQASQPILKYLDITTRSKVARAYQRP